LNNEENVQMTNPILSPEDDDDCEEEINVSSNPLFSSANGQRNGNPEQQLFNLQHIQPPPAANSDNSKHRKSRSRVLPRSLKNKKLPPKPPNKKRTQTNAIPQPPPMPMQMPQTTNFSDLNFNAQQHSKNVNAQNMNFQHGQTMYTAQW